MERHELAVGRKYTWKRDGFDPRDHVYGVATPIKLPTKVDLRPSCPPVLDQGSIGSCVAHSTGNAHLFAQMLQPGGSNELPSRLWIYMQARKMEGTLNQDAGCMIRDAIKSLASLGAPPESEWPYVTAKFAEDVTAKYAESAAKHKIVSYTSVPQTLTSLKTALAREKHPICFGIMLYASFESQTVAATGVVPMPKPKEQCLGGHAVLIVGYDDSKGAFIVMNSWSDSWGDHGYFYLPYGYVTNPKLASDFWQIKIVAE